MRAVSISGFACTLLALGFSFVFMPCSSLKLLSNLLFLVPRLRSAMICLPFIYPFLSSSLFLCVALLPLCGCCLLIFVSSYVELILKCMVAGVIFVYAVIRGVFFVEKQMPSEHCCTLFFCPFRSFVAVEVVVLSYKRSCLCPDGWICFYSK